MSDWIVVKATCTTAGEKYKVCQRSGCNHKVVEEGYAEAYPALGHDFEGAEWVIEAPPAPPPASGIRCASGMAATRRTLTRLMQKPTLPWAMSGASM